MDRPYFVAKELLMTERTYKKDLEIINLVRKKGKVYNFRGKNNLSSLVCSFSGSEMR